MNKHLLDTRMRSITHYNGELAKLRDALTVTELTKKDIIDSLKEFFPFENGDILMKGSNLYQVSITANNPVTVFETGTGQIAFNVWLLILDYRDYRQQWRKCSSSPDTLKLVDLDEYKVISNTEKK